MLKCRRAASIGATLAGGHGTTHVLALCRFGATLVVKPYLAFTSAIQQV
jgi:hypothetical protein